MTVEVEFDPIVTLSPNKKWSFHFDPVDLTALGATFYFTADYSTVNMRIDGWREAEGLQIPGRLRVMGGPVHSPMRTITITDAQLTETRPEPPKDADRIQ